MACSGTEAGLYLTSTFIYTACSGMKAGLYLTSDISSLYCCV